MNKKIQALAVLLVMLGGFLTTFKSQNTFLILLNHGFLAGLIGGLADWYAVVAIFRKPLGFVTFRSEVLIKNRVRITSAIIDFVCKDLLSYDNLKMHLKNYNFALLLGEYYKIHIGEHRLNKLLQPVVMSMQSYLNGFCKIVIDRISYRLSLNYELSNDIDRYFETPAGKETLGIILNTIDQKISDTLKTQDVHEFLEENIELIKAAYVKDSNMRAMMFNMANISGEKMATKLDAALCSYIDKCFDEDSKEFTQFKDFTKKITTSFIKSSFKMNSPIYLSKTIDIDFSNSDKMTNIINQNITSAIDKYLQNLSRDGYMQNYYNDKISDFIIKIFENNRNYLEEFMTHELNKYDAKQFVRLVEAKISDDLQMIRINGSLVGFAVGFVLTLIKLGLEVWRG